MTLPDNYIRWNSDSDTVYLLQLSGNGHNVSVASSIVISSSLGVRAFLKGESIGLSLGIISDIRQIETIIGEISGKDTVTDLPNSIHEEISKGTELLKQTIEFLEEISNPDLTSEPESNSQSADEYSETFPQIARLQFILFQLENVTVHKKRRKYNFITQVVALKSHLISPICYNYLQSLDCLSLPHHRNIQKLYTNDGIDSDYITFLKQATVNFTLQQRIVIVQKDEIHVKSDLTYKGGKVIGSSGSLHEPIRTLLALMVSSLYKKWSTIVRLIPCSTTTAESLFPTIEKIIRDIELCGLQVQVLCTDNYPLNVSIFKKFSPEKTLDCAVPHPCDSNRLLFLMFDFVHILKSIRNNWLNLKYFNKTFRYPQFDNMDMINIASFEEIRQLYRSQQNKIIKLAQRLTSKSCWSSTLERQNVGIAQRIFDESTSAALAIQNSSKSNPK